MPHHFGSTGICEKCGTSKESALAFGWPCETSGSGRHRKDLTVADYVDWLSGVPLPSAEQRDNFVRYFAHAHSWYKGLPAYLPGRPFHFYINKYAACERASGESGTLILKERRTLGPHYSDIPTNEYRKRFGYLDYSVQGRRGPTIYFAPPVAATNDDEIVLLNHERLELPADVVKLCTAELTCVIHTLSGSLTFWENGAQSKSGTVEWPEESGGQSALKKIFQRCREMSTPGFKMSVRPKTTASLTSPEEAIHTAFVDPILHELLLPERQRQYRLIGSAIDQLCGLIDDERSR